MEELTNCSACDGDEVGDDDFDDDAAVVYFCSRNYNKRAHDIGT